MDKKPILEVCPVSNGVRFDPSLIFTCMFMDQIELFRIRFQLSEGFIVEPAYCEGLETKVHVHIKRVFGLDILIANVNLFMIKIYAFAMSYDCNSATTVVRAIDWRHHWMKVRHVHQH